MEESLSAALWSGSGGDDIDYGNSDDDPTTGEGIQMEVDDIVSCDFYDDSQSSSSGNFSGNFNLQFLGLPHVVS